MKTHFPTKEQADSLRKWFVVDAQEQVVGRLAAAVASKLRGKDNPCFTPHLDTGDFVVVINADKIRFTGQKELRKNYFRHTGHIGGIKKRTPAEVRETHPERIIKTAVKGMLPHNSLGRSQLKKLKVYCGPEHPHQAQQPETLSI